MTWADQLEEQEANLIQIKKEWEGGMKIIEDNLITIEQALRSLENKGLKGNKVEYLEWKRLLQINLDYKQRYLAKKEEFRIAREVLDKAWLKTEELRYKGLRG